MLEREKLVEELKKTLSNEEQQDLQANKTLQNAIFPFSLRH